MKKNIAISIGVFIAGLCSIIYELLISTAATYFLGDSVKQFSLTIGIYLFSMGIGAFVSKFSQRNPLNAFVSIEFLLGLIGGLSIPFMYFMFIRLSISQMQWTTWFYIFVIGLLTGLEVPLLTFAVNNVNFKESLSNILSLDYIGGLIATLIFPFILLPFVGLFYSSLIFGAVNILLGIFMSRYVESKSSRNKYMLFGVVSILLLGGLTYKGADMLKIWEEKIYKAPIAVREQTPYQHIVMTKKKDDIRLFLNRVIQFSSKDEHRYHESLVHTPMLMHPEAKDILILGGGENLAAREMLKHQAINKIDIVDLDSMVFHLAMYNHDLLKINKAASLHPKVNMIVEDAFNYLSTNANQYDLIISDLPDPNSEATAKLYTKQFFELAKNNLKEDGIFITQSGEIYMSNAAFSCIVNTMKTVYENVQPIHCYIPSFGDWGFVMGSKRDLVRTDLSQLDKIHTKFLTDKVMANSFGLPKDVDIIDTKINTLDNPIILQYFLEDWEKWKADLVPK